MSIKDYVKNNKAVRGLCSKCSWFFCRGFLAAGGKCKFDTADSFVVKTHLNINGMDNCINIGSGCVLRYCTIHINGDGNYLDIGDDVHLVNCNIFLIENNNTISIGKHTTIAGNTDLVTGEGSRLSIGDSCLFSKDIIVRTGDAHSILDVQGNRINHSQDINIGDRVWITQGAKLLKGSQIGNDTIIAASAVVTSDYSNENNVIIGGIPGKVIKHDISWVSERI